MRCLMCGKRHRKCCPLLDKKPKENECAICFAMKHKEIDIDLEKNYYICRKHLPKEKDELEKEHS